MIDIGTYDLIQQDLARRTLHTRRATTPFSSSREVVVQLIRLKPPQDVQRLFQAEFAIQPGLGQVLTQQPLGLLEIQDVVSVCQAPCPFVERGNLQRDSRVWQLLLRQLTDVAP
ncbi:hypothetical protein D3C80_944330 [compost metagenome]